MYDLRFPSAAPLVSLPGHVNSFSTGLGLASWQDNFLAAAGQDCRFVYSVSCSPIPGRLELTHSIARSFFRNAACACGRSRPADS